MKNSDVVIGQLIGFTIIFGISLCGILFGIFIDLEYVALIGFLPILIGLFQTIGVIKFWYRFYTKKYNNYSDPLIPADDIGEVGDHMSASSEISNSTASSEGVLAGAFRRYTSSWLRPSIITVTVTIFADGSEEIGVFLPLFATSTTSDLVVIVITFYTLILLQCALAYQLVRCQHVGKFISRYSKNIMPLVLIGIGLYVLSDSILAHMIA
mmetsp:Transcript_476/g.589  ORF Transcript_476/g.589 Transcript_476/m.589 type:complete len:211 (+) Transcript_476:40-672(+)